MSFLQCGTLDLSLEFRECLVEFASELLKHRPQDIDKFALEYFTVKLRDKKYELRKDEKMTDFNKLIRNGSESQFGDDMQSNMVHQTRRLAINAVQMKPHDSLISSDFMIKIEKSDTERENLNRLLTRVVIFKSLDNDILNQVIDSMVKIDVSENEYVFHEGQEGEFFCVIESGIFEEYRMHDNVQVLENTYNNQGSFGELSLLYGGYRCSSIVAKTSGVLWIMNKMAFSSISYFKAHSLRLKLVDFLDKVEILKSLTTEEQINLVDVMNIRNYNINDVILRENDIGEFMFIIEKGDVELQVQVDLDVKCVGNLKEGDYYGEMSLMTNQPYKHTVVAKHVSSLAILTRECFERVIGLCIDVVRRDDDQFSKLFDYFNT